MPLQVSPFHQRLYRRLASQLPPEGQQNVAQAVDLSNGVRFDPKRVEYVYGEGVTRLIVGKTTAMRQNVHQVTRPTRINARNKPTTRTFNYLTSLRSR